MELLFDKGAPQESGAVVSERKSEACPKCGRMAEYVERFANGRFMASHGSELRRRGSLMVECAIICHGFEKQS